MRAQGGCRAANSRKYRGKLAEAAARLFDGTGGARLPVPDLVSLTSLTHCPDGGEPAEAWAPSDYALEPYNAAPATPWGAPYASILALGRAERQAFEAGRRNYEVNGVWGYGQLAEPSGASVADPGGVGAAQTTVSVNDGAHFAPGQTLLLGEEQALVTAVSGDTLTVRRALNGTTGAAHAQGAVVALLRWPAPVERAALINAARIWTRAPAFEPFYVDADLDTDVRLLLDPYRRTAT